MDLQEYPLNMTPHTSGGGDSKDILGTKLGTKLGRVPEYVPVLCPVSCPVWCPRFSMSIESPPLSESHAPVWDRMERVSLYGTIVPLCSPTFMVEAGKGREGGFAHSSRLHSFDARALQLYLRGAIWRGSAEMNTELRIFL